MKNVLLAILFIVSLVTTNVFGDSNSIQKNSTKKWDRVLKLLQDEKRTINMLGARSVTYKHRLFEIDTELIKIKKAKEHNQFFSDAKKGKLKGDKNYYYRGSKKLFWETQKRGKLIVNKYPRYQRLAEVLYTMGLNERDYNNSKWSRGYFLQARKRTENTRLRYLLDVQLAEYSYNKKQYELASKYYKLVVRNKEDKWLTKHVYNYAWCIFKQKDYAFALSLLNSALDLGKQDKYEAVSEQIFEAAISFYVYSKKITEGVRFFEKGSITKSEKFDWLLKFSKKSAEKGFFQESMYVYQKAFSYANEEQKNVLLLDKLAFFRNFKDENRYKETIKDIVRRKKSLKKEEKESFVTEVLNFSGFKQRKLQQSFNKVSGQYSKKSLRDVLFYFDNLVKMDMEHSDKYRYFQGETLFGVRELAKSAKYYLGALKSSVNRPKKEKILKENKEQQDKIFNALFSVMQTPQIPEVKRDKISFYVYKQYITENPKNKRSIDVYKALFDLSIDQKKEIFAKNSLVKFRKNHPSFSEKQKEMFFYLFDTGIERKKSDFVATLIKDMGKLQLSFSKVEKKKAVASLGSLVFTEIEKVEKKLSIDQLVEKYKKLYENKLYPQVIRANSAFKLSQFFADNFDVQKSYEWSNESMSLYSKKEMMSLRKDFKNKIYKYMELQSFDVADRMLETYVSKYCLQPKNDITEIIGTKVSLGQVLDTEKELYFNLKRFQKCGAKEESIVKLQNVLVSHLLDTFKTEDVYYLIRKDKYLTSDYIVSHFYQNYWNEKEKDLSIKALKILKPRSHKAFKSYESIVTFNRISKEISKMSYVNLSEVITKDNFQDELGEFVSKNIEINSKMVELFNKSSAILHDRAKLKILELLNKQNSIHQEILSKFSIKDLDAETMNIVKGELSPIGNDLKKQSNNFELQISNIKNNSLEMFSKSTDVKLYKLTGEGGV